MKIVPVIKRLKQTDVCPLLNAQAHYGKSIISLDRESEFGDVPISFVYATTEKPKKNQQANATSQQVDKYCLVVTIARAWNESQHGDNEPIEDVRDEIKKALIGQRLVDQHAPFSYVDGAQIEATTRLVLWHDYFSTWHLMCGA